MAKMNTDFTQLIKHVNALIALDFDAIEAYEAAMLRLNEASDRSQLAASKAIMNAISPI
jgi:hypothetical protein